MPAIMRVTKFGTMARMMKPTTSAAKRGINSQVLLLSNSFPPNTRHTKVVAPAATKNVAPEAIPAYFANMRVKAIMKPFGSRRANPITRY